MATSTEYLKLYKVNTIDDGDLTFNIDKMLNENWDKIDVSLKNTNSLVSNTGSDIKAYADQVQKNAYDYTDKKTSEINSTITTMNGVIAQKETPAGAQAKANTAESNAKSYTDSKANTAESNAKSYADSKANTAETNAKGYTDSRLQQLINSAPAALDTLKELADALGNDANFSTSILNKISSITGGHKYFVEAVDPTTISGTNVLEKDIWFDITEKLIKIRISNKWEAFGAVYLT